MNKYAKIGYEYFTCPLALNELLKLVKEHHFQIYGLSFNNGNIIFKVKAYNYYRVIKSHKDITHLYSSGLIGFIKHQLFNKRRVLGMLSAFLTLYICSNTLLEVEVVGNNSNIKTSISEYLIENNIHRFSYIQDESIFKRMEEEIKQMMFDKIEWINFEYNNSQLIVRYIPRNIPILYEDSYEPLVAKKDGVIKFFDVSSGRKMFLVNDLVKAGDILVSNEVIDSSNQIKPVKVEGKIYGNTFVVIESNLSSSNNISDSLAFFRLLFDCRLQISKHLSSDEKIEQENILQFSKSDDTINMKIQYTLYEDLTKE